MRSIICSAVLFSFISLSAVTLVLPQNATVQEKTAARELVLHLSKIYNRKIRTVSEDKSFNDNKVIYIGQTRFAAANNINVSRFAQEEHLVKAVDGKNLIVTGEPRRGVIYGALDLLEKYYGVLWLDDEFTVTPRTKLTDWPKGLTLKGKPDFQIRCFHTYWSARATLRLTAAMRNRQNFFHDHRYLPLFNNYGLERIYGSPRACHTYYNYTKDWGKDEMACFSLDKRGRRIRSTSPGGPGQICWTNPRTVKLFSQKLRQFILEDQKKYGKPYPWLYEVSDNDNPYRCHCKNCLAMAKKYKGYTGVVIDFTNRLARTIAKEFPYVKIQMMAYKDPRQVPVGIKADPNVWIRIGMARDTVRPLEHPNNRKIAETFRKYGPIGTVTFWDWWVMYYDTMMGVFHDAIPSFLRYSKSMGVSSLMVELQKPMETPFYQLRLWLGRRFMVNTRLDLDRETDRFMKAYYGPKAAPVMKELLNYMIKRESQVKAVLNTLAPRQRPDLDEAFFKTTNRLVEKALRLADKPIYKKHVRKERFVLDWANVCRNRTRVFFDPQVFSKRLKSDFELHVPLYLRGDVLDKFRKDVDDRLTALVTKIPDVHIEGYDVVIDLPWPRLYEFRTRTSKGIRISRRIPDPDAAGGKAIYLADEPPYAGKLRMGYYNMSDKEHSRDLDPAKVKIPQDEKYHLYHIGKITLGPKGYFWAHPTWMIQTPANQFYNPNDPAGKRVNDYELFMSVKVTGPNYVKGSKKESGYYLDRIILARKKNK